MTLISRRTRSLWAAFFLVTLLQSLLLPSVAHALTSGPTTPEVADFEAVDATDMVNLLTGDFVYNLPLLNVPGPEGGFPINLFYHAGIKTQQEASAYGLGWGINPGAITRSVVGFPDDYLAETGGASNVYSIYDDRYDSGITETAYSFGVSIPRTQIGFTFTENSNSRLGNYGTTTMRVGDLYEGGSTYSASGWAQSHQILPSVVKFLSQNQYPTATGLSNITSQSTTYSLSDGIVNTINGKSGDWNYEVTSQTRLSLLGRREVTTRRWLDISKPVKAFGSLGDGLGQHAQQGLSTGFAVQLDLIEDQNTAKEEDNSGTVGFAHDRYLVQGAQVGGSLQPVIYQNGSLRGRELIANNEPHTAYHELKAFDGYFTTNDTEDKPRFRYRGEFAANYEMPSGNISISGTAPLNVQASSSSFIASPTDDPVRGFKRRYLKGKKYVEYFGLFDMGYFARGQGHSPEATKKVKNFVLNIPPNYVESDFGNSKVHAFKVTDESGVEHHYGLPVFISYEESVNFEAERLKAGQLEEQTSPAEAYSRQRKASAYPYAWLQTAQLGPDYLDRNDNGRCDPADYGSYIRFAYGNHTQDKPYPFRGPYKGYDFDPTLSTKGATFGEKQLFYPNCIQTRTHTALFFQSERLDGRGASKDALDASLNANEYTFDQLKTDKIVLLRNEDVKALLASGHLVDKGVDWNAATDGTHLPYLAADYNSTIEQKALRIIEFNYDYTLCRGTDNSVAPGQGKLTLQSLRFFGQGRSSALPAYNFGYDHYNPLANPNFARDAYDRWGYYKGDVELVGPMGARYPKHRKVTCSTLDPAAWSLRSIELPVGGKIRVNYETDRYYRVANGDFSIAYDQLRSFQSSSPLDYSAEFFTAEYGAQKIKIPNTDRGQALKAYLEEAKNNNRSVSLVTRHDFNGDPNAGQEYCENYEVTNINTLPSGEFEAHFSSTVYPVFDPHLIITAVVLRTIGQAHETVCNVGGESAVFGGGIRVQQIQVLNGNDEVQYSQEYHYEKSVQGNGYSSGVTALEPPALEVDKGALLFEWGDARNTSIGGVGPGVTYSDVMVLEKAKDGSFVSKTKYQFETYDEATHLQVNNTEYPQTNGARTFINQVLDKTNYLGRPLAVESYNSQGLLESKKTYEYYDVPPNRQGITKEVVHSIRSRTRAFGNSNCWVDGYAAYNYEILGISAEPYKALITEKHSYPSVLKKVITESNGYQNSTDYVVFDFFTGENTTRIDTDANGRRLKTIRWLAASKYPAMGSKVDDEEHHHMLVQSTYTQVSEINQNGYELGLLSASINTWEEDWLYRERLGDFYTNAQTPVGEEVFRPKANYVWEGNTQRPDGTSSDYPAPVDQNFDWVTNTPQNGSSWLRLNRIDRYDHHSQALERMDVNDNYAATKLGYDETLVLATCGHSRYTEFYYSGAEDPIGSTGHYGGEVRNLNGITNTDSTFAHTGSNSTQVPPNKYGFIINPSVDSDLRRDKHYRAQVWLYDNGNLASKKLFAHYSDMNGNILGPTVNAYREVKGDAYILRAGNWVRLDLDVEIEASIPVGRRLTVGVTNLAASPSDAYFDDFRFAPLDAAVTSYVYDPETDELRFVLDAENIFTEYQYDALGRLEKVYQETTENPTGRRLVSKHQINYAR